MYTDPIADMLTRIRNAAMAKKPAALVPYSKVKFKIAQVLQEAGYLQSVEKIEDRFGSIKIELAYNGRRPTIQHLQRVSKPGRRVYAKKDTLPFVLNDYGIAVVSTPKGIMTNKQARKAGLGGEVICEAY